VVRGLARRHFAAFDRIFSPRTSRTAACSDWTDAIAELRRRYGRNGTNIKAGGVHVYILELVCDLFLDTAKCVSNSAGFERFLEEFGGRADGNGEADAQDDYDVN
jgi:hypothetical protein